MTLGFLSKVIGASYLKALVNEEHTHTQNLRAAAHRAGWPKEAVDGLSIRLVNGKYVDSIDPSVKDLVDNITFGSTSKQPSHVILAFMRTLGQVG